MKTKRLLYITSSRDPLATAPRIEDYFAKQPWGHSAILYHLRELGWTHLRLGIRESWEPFRVARRLREFRPDLVFTYGVTALAPVIARRRLCRWRGPIVHAWDDYYDEIWRDNWGRVAGAFMRRFEKIIIKSMDAVTTLSYYNLDRARRWGIPSWFIPNGCDQVEGDLEKSSIRLEGDFKLVYMGDHSRYKRAYEVVEAMRQLPDGFKLYLVGKPYDYLVRMAPPNVAFLGPRYGDDKWAVMRQADALVCTADQDCNIKFHEYLRMRKPILAYDGRPNLLFKNGHNACLTRDYASAIRDLANSPELRARLVENAARDIPVYTWREIAEQFDRTFGEILGQYRSASGNPETNR